MITFKVYSLAYIANSWNGNENLVTVQSSSFESQNECVNYFQYKQRKLKMIIMPAYFVVCSAKIIT